MAAGDLLTADLQIEWRGLVLGAGTPYRWVSLEGWLDLPSMRAGDVEIPGRHGEQPGRLTASGRTITFTANVVTPPDQFAGVLAQLDAATAPREPGEDVEEPLVIRLHGQRHMVWARVHRRAIPTDHHYALGYTRAIVQWKATNPHKLALPAVTVSTGLPDPNPGGLRWPLAFPLAFGPARVGGEFTVTNLGTVAAEPTWVIRGPVTGPWLRDPDTGRTLEFAPTFEVPAGVDLVLDHAAGTVLLAGVSRSHELLRRGWFPLRPGTTRVQFGGRSYHPDARLTCTYHHTTM